MLKGSDDASAMPTPPWPHAHLSGRPTRGRPRQAFSGVPPVPPLERREPEGAGGRNPELAHQRDIGRLGLGDSGPLYRAESGTPPDAQAVHMANPAAPAVVGDVQPVGGGVQTALPQEAVHLG